MVWRFRFRRNRHNHGPTFSLAHQASACSEDTDSLSAGRLFTRIRSRPGLVGHGHHIRPSPSPCWRSGYTAHPPPAEKAPIRWSNVNRSYSAQNGGEVSACISFGRRQSGSISTGPSRRGVRNKLHPSAPSLGQYNHRASTIAPKLFNNGRNIPVNQKDGQHLLLRPAPKPHARDIDRHCPTLFKRANHWARPVMNHRIVRRLNTKANPSRLVQRMSFPDTVPSVRGSRRQLQVICRLMTFRLVGNRLAPFRDLDPAQAITGALTN